MTEVFPKQKVAEQLDETPMVASGLSHLVFDCLTILKLLKWLFSVTGDMLGAHTHAVVLYWSWRDAALDHALNPKPLLTPFGVSWGHNQSVHQ